VLTGTRAMAMLEKTWPAIWNRLIMNVPWNMWRDGLRMPHPPMVLTLMRRLDKPPLAWPVAPPRPRRSRRKRTTTQ